MIKLTISIALLLLLSQAALSQHDYKEALHKTTFYYGAQRCGDNQSWIHEACHTRDGERDGLDLTGGWHDCGDNIKFAQTNAFTATVLLQTYNRFPEGFADNYSQAYSAPPKNGIPDILDEVKIFTDYLLKTLVDGKVYYQTGDKRDHNSLSDPVYQSKFAPVDSGGEPRYSYFITEGGSNYCGAAASALSLMSMNYREFDANYADQCKEKAKEYFAVGLKNPGPVVDYDKMFYSGTTKWEDDMILGGTQLYRVTGEPSYLAYAESLSLETYHVPTGVSMDYNNCGPLMAYELCLTSERDSVKEKCFKSLVGWSWETTGEIGGELLYLLNGMTDCGYGHYMDWGSLKYTTAAAQTALLIHDLTGIQEAYDFAKKNIDFCLGSHEELSGDATADFSFVVGYDKLGGGSAQYPHHTAAFGREANAGELWVEEDKNPGMHPFKHELVGALVGGPTKPCEGYEDRIDNYYSNEVCIYYNCHIVSSLAYIIREENIGTPIINSSNVASSSIKNQRINTTSQLTLPAAQFKGQKVSYYTLSGRELGTINLTSTEQLVDLQKELNISHQFVLGKISHK